jgi:hypothetical protein
VERKACEMAFEVKWKEEKSVLLIKISGEHSLEDNRLMIASVVEHLDQAKPPVFTVWELGEMAKYPHKVKEIWDTGQPLLKHQNLTHIIFLGLNNPILKFLTSVVSNMGHLRFHNESDWEGAERAIEKLKSTYSLIET